MKDTLSDETREAESECTRISAMTKEMAGVAGTIVTVPGRCDWQIRRSTMPEENLEVYYRCVLFNPFLDDPVEPLESRFSVRKPSRSLA